MASTETDILSQLAKTCKEARELFAKTDMLVRSLGANGILASDGTVSVDEAAFAGTLAGLDSRDIKGIVELFNQVQTSQTTAIDTTDARTQGAALLRFAARSR